MSGAPPVTRADHLPRVPGAGSDVVHLANAPEEAVRLWVTGDTFPRIVLDVPNHAVLVGDGTVAPIPLSTGGGGTDLSLGIRRDVIANRGAFGNAGFLFGATDTLLGYRDSGTSWDPYFPVLDSGGHISASVISAIAESQVTNLVAHLGLKAPIASPVFTGTVTIPTGASITAPTGLVKADVGLGSVDNTADTAKPVSTAQQTALNLKANIASPTFTGTVTLPATGAGPNEATTKSYVDAAIAALVASAPGTLDTLNELATALGNDPNFATSTATLIGTKLAIAQNLADLNNVATARTNLGLGTAALISSTAGGDLVGTLPSPTLAPAGPGATGPLGTAARVPVVTIDAKGRVVGLTDIAIAIAESAVTGLVTDLGLKAPIASPVFTGTVTIPTGALIASPVINTGVSGTAIDVDATMAANSDTLLATQKAIKTALATKAAKTAAGGPYGSATAIPAITVNADGSLAFNTNAIVLPKFGGLLVIGHSYTQNGGNRSSQGAPGLDVWSNWTHRVAGALQIPVEETFLWGKSSARIGAATLGDGSTLQGSGVVMRHHHPNHWYTPNLLGHQSSKGWPALCVLEYGYNEISHGWKGGSHKTQAETAYKHGLRSVISRLRARLLHSSDETASSPNGFITYTGTWSAQTDKNYCTKGKYQKTTTGSDSFTITLPTTLEGDSSGAVTVAVCMVGTPNAFALTTNATTSTSLPVDARDDFPQSGSFDIVVNGQTRTVTAGWGAGAGTFTLSSSATWTAGQEVVRASGATVTWSGTATGASGTTTIGGQGNVGVPCHVVKRFTGLTNADAGKTIVGTVAGFATSEEFDLDSWWIEETDPQQVLCVNQPFGAMGTSLNLVTEADITSFNSDLTAVIAEFSNNVEPVDLVPTYSSLYRAVIETSHGATGTGATIHITPNDATNCVIGIGSVLHCEQEEMLVTAITKTSPTDWQLTVTRNYTTSPDGQSTGGNVTHATTTPIYDMRPWTMDRVHPSDEGHVLIASLVLGAVAVSTQTAREIANSGGYVQKRQPKLIDGGFLWTMGGTRIGLNSTTLPAQLNKLTAGRVYIPEAVTLTLLQMETASSYAATGVARLGVYADGNQGPGALIADLGTVATTSTAVQSISCWIPLKPGWYWFCGVLQSTVATGSIRGTTDVRSYQPFSSGATTPFGSAFADNNGVLLSGVSGALPDPFGTPSGYQAGTTAATAIMTVAAQYTIPIKD